MAKEKDVITKKAQANIPSPKEKELSQKLNSARLSFIMWRYISLGLTVVTFGLLVFTKDCYSEREIWIEVLDKPLAAGVYHVSELPDDDLLAFGEEFINLVATYQPQVAEKQFLYAFDMSSGEFKNKFREQYVKRGVKEIIKSKRSQIFYADYEPSLTRVPNKDYVVVSLRGELEKYADERNFNTPASYTVKLKTIPHSKMNEYGISVVDLQVNSGNGY